MVYRNRLVSKYFVPINKPEQYSLHWKKLAALGYQKKKGATLGQNFHFIFFKYYNFIFYHNLRFMCPMNFKWLPMIEIDNSVVVWWDIPPENDFNQNSHKK